MDEIQNDEAPKKSRRVTSAEAPSEATEVKKTRTRKTSEAAEVKSEEPKTEKPAEASEERSERPQREFDGERPERHGGNRNRNRNRNRNDRFRDRNRNRNDRDEAEPEISPDDVLIPVAGILDILDNYAFVRTSGYLAGPNDVYVSLGQVKKYSLRKGDAVIGAIRQPREGEHQGRQKFNALVRIDSVNGQTPEQASSRVEFGKLTPLYPQSRLRLETEPTKLSKIGRAHV